MKNNTQKHFSGLAARWLEAGESLNSSEYAKIFAEDGRLSIGNFPTAKGRKEIAASSQNVFDRIKGLEHEINAFWEEDRTTIIEGKAYYILKNESEVIIPIAAIVRVDRSDILIKEASVYLDPSPLLSN